jgi:large conductance mechanosensitive channel
VRIGTDPAGKPVLFRYGAFIQTIIEFVIIAFVIFVLLKGINTLKRPPPATAAAPPPPTKSEQLLTDIRDLLAKK